MSVVQPNPRRLPALRLLVPLVLVGGFVLITLFSMGLSIAARKQQMLAETNAQAQRDISLLARDAERFLAREPALLREDIALLMTNPRLLAALVVDDKGVIVHAHTPGWEGAAADSLLPGDDLALRMRAMDTRLSLTEEHRLPRRELDIALSFQMPAGRADVRSTARGVAYLSYDLGDADAEAVRAGIRARLPDLLALVLGTALMLWLTNRLFAAPLAQLARASSAAAEGRFERVPDMSAVREVHELAEAFNRMIDAVEERDRELLRSKESLEQTVQERTRELRRINHELESFSYSVSHDLRAPLRAIDGFSQALLEDGEARLEPQDVAMLGRVRGAAQKMGRLIESLLKLSRVTRKPVTPEPLDLAALAREVCAELREQYPDRLIEFRIGDVLAARGDRDLLRAALYNLLGNACKYTGREPHARIEFDRAQVDGREAFYVRDNGVGFEMQYADRLFGAFQRLHPDAEFEGTGIGLATVYRIIARHGGEIWAESSPGEGATFWFTLP